jgi:hypothetical protein
MDYLAKRGPMTRAGGPRPEPVEIPPTPDPAQTPPPTEFPPGPGEPAEPGGPPEIPDRPEPFESEPI